MFFKILPIKLKVNLRVNPVKKRSVGLQVLYLTKDWVEKLPSWNSWFSFSNMTPFLSYCWWKKSCTNWDVLNLVNNQIKYLSPGAGFLNHQQYAGQRLCRINFLLVIILWAPQRSNQSTFKSIIYSIHIPLRFRVWYIYLHELVDFCNKFGY